MTVSHKSLSNSKEKPVTKHSSRGMMHQSKAEKQMNDQNSALMNVEEMDTSQNDSKLPFIRAYGFITVANGLQCYR